MVHRTTGTRTSLVGSPVPLYTSSRLGRWQKHTIVEMQRVIHPSSQLEDGQENQSVRPFPRESCTIIFSGEKRMGFLHWCFIQNPGSPLSWLMRNCCWLRASCIPCWSNITFCHLHLCPCLLQPHGTITWRLQEYFPSFLYTVRFFSSFTHI